MDPVQPNQHKYGIEELFLFPLLTAAQAGHPAPIPGAPFQAWKDASVQPGAYRMKTYPVMWDSVRGVVLRNENYPEWFACNYNFASGVGTAPIPMREFLPNEQIHSNPLADPQYWIERTDMKPDGSVIAVPTASPVTLDTLNEKLDRILKNWSL